MNRLACHLLLTALVSVPLACGDDSSTGSGTETESGSGTGGSGSTSTNETATATATTTTTGVATMGGSTDSTTGPSTTGSTGVDSSGGPAESTGMGATTTGGGAACDDCVATNCSDELAACLDNMDCACWVDCLAMGNGFQECGMMCGGMPPGELFGLQDCTDTNCAVECAGTGVTYDPCGSNMDCAPDTVCNGFLGYCSLDCMGDDTNCPMPATGDVVPICGGMSNNCILPCGNGDTCPDGMMCAGGGGGGFQRCVPN